MAENETSLWNQAEQYQDRIDEIFCGCHVASREDDYNFWLKCLWMLHRELAALMKNTEQEDIEKLLAELEKKTNQWSEGLLFNLTKKFSTCEIKLRTIHKERGMLTAFGGNKLPVFDD